MPALHRAVLLALPNMPLLDVAAPTQFFGHPGAGRCSYELARRYPAAMRTHFQCRLHTTPSSYRRSVTGR